MDDWDAHEEDDSAYEQQRRDHEVRVLNRRMAKIGFTEGLETIEGQEHPEVQESFDNAFVAAFQTCFRLGEAAGKVLSLEYLAKFSDTLLNTLEATRREELANKVKLAFKEGENKSTEQLIAAFDEEYHRFWRVRFASAEKSASTGAI